MNLLPLWTAMVCPTKSGDIIEALDQVFTTLFLPLSFMAMIFFSKVTAMYGPFFNERLRIYSLNSYFLALALSMIYLFEAFFGALVLRPLAYKPFLERG